MKGFIDGYARGRLIKELHGINESLSKIESKLNLTGTAGECKAATEIYEELNKRQPKCSICGKVAVCGQGTALQATIHFCEDHRPTAGECICTHRTLLDPDCPVHGLPKSTPDLPLKCKVAEALDWVVTTDKIDGKWIGHHKQITSGVWWFAIKDYPNDLEAAMGALEEYCRKWDLSFRITWSTQGIWIIIRHVTWGASIVKTLGKYDDVDGLIAEDLYACDLPQAICEAIVAHKEAQ